MVRLQADPEDISQIGALKVLRKLADHLGLQLTDHDLRATWSSFYAESHGFGTRSEGLWRSVDKVEAALQGLTVY